MVKPLTIPRLRLPAPLLIILGLFVAAKVLYLLKYHLPVWDEAVYLGMGKYIYSLGQSGLWETIRPPGLPLIIGALWKLRLPYVFFSEIIIMLFGIGSILLSYLIANKLFGKSVAILSVALLATSPWFYLYSSYILTEVPSAFLALLAIYAFISRRYFLSGAAAAAAMLFKFPNGLVLVAIAATLLAGNVIKKLQLKSQLLPMIKVFAAFFVVTLPFFVFNYIFYRPFTGNAFDAVLRPIILGVWHQSNPSKVIAGSLHNYFFYFVEAFKQHFALVFAMAAIFLFWKRKWFADRGKLLLAIFLLAYLAYFTYIPNKDERYILAFLPAICIFTAAAFIDVTSYFRRLGNGIAKPIRSLVLVAAVSLFVLSFAVAAYKDYHFYSWRPASEPSAVSELYGSIARFGITGTVLTSEPVFAAYNDNLFLAYYDTSSGVPNGLKPSWNLSGRPFEAVVFSPESFSCSFGDFGCYDDVEKLHSIIESNYAPVFNGTYYDGTITYYVFVNESMYPKRKSQ